jgi:autophagy-related protein 16
MLLCSTRDDTSLRVIDLRQNAITSTFSGFNLSTDWSKACFSPDGQYVAVGGADGMIYIWEVLTGRAHKVKRDSSAHRCLIWSMLCVL